MITNQKILMVKFNNKLQYVYIVKKQKCFISFFAFSPSFSLSLSLFFFFSNSAFET